ncbi:DUF2264 domain-containing protein [uncultured Cohaesibacter sp.]|uniref:DUF2264 domain-containing protein n=1 Tax=uncultured Cohaesibacter sp. TaxID=1002546 RepID=UPI002931D363|nr:DUF2264 domain-containing protein [uncultured Cohaesibacter sp.]
MMKQMSAWDRLPVTREMVKRNPMFGNPLRTRDDLARAVLGFYEPLKPYFSDGGGRLRLAVSATHYDQTAAEMEAFVRPLWGLVPMMAGGYGFDDVSRYIDGLANGMDPEHPDYWGEVGPYDQRMVEMAGIATAFLLAPESFWEPMTDRAKDNVAHWLLSINAHPMPDNNWLFFRILTNLALRNVGRQWSESIVREGLDRIETFYLGDGYYRDGEWKQRDYYLPMALHFYGLMVAGLAGDLFPEHAKRYRERARLFARDFQHWFADDGAAIPFGRSLTYRFAQGAFWAGCAFAGEEVLPWGQIKGLLLRHLRWWSDQPFAERDGVMSIGYVYPNLFMSEAYNAPGSPYWALKSFIVLALPQDHPFWQAEEEAMPPSDGEVVLAPAAGFAMRRADGDAVLLMGGQDGHEHRAYDAKYARFAYSSAFAFSVKSDMTSPDYADRSAVDSGMMASFDDLSWISRGHILKAGIRDDLVYGVWQPDERLTVESWLDFASQGWHVRLHRISATTSVSIAESGFSVDRTCEKEPGFQKGLVNEAGRVEIRTPDATSAMVDLSTGRQGEIVRASPNTNIRYPRTLFPRLVTRLPAGRHFLATAVYGLPSHQDEIGDLILSQKMKALMLSFGLVTVTPG